MATAVATEVPRTRSGRPKVPALDTAAIAAEAKARVDAALAEAEKHPSKERTAALRALKAHPTDPDLKKAAAKALTEDRLTALAQLEGAADDLLIEKEAYMFRLALSLHLHEGARGVSNAIGIGREAFSKRVTKALGDEHRPLSWDESVSELARKHRVNKYGNAATELPKVAQEVALARALKLRIRPARNELIKELSEQGATRVYIAGIIGREPSRVSHIVTGRGR